MGYQWCKYQRYCDGINHPALLVSCPVNTKLQKSILLVLTHLLMLVVLSGSSVNMDKKACETVGEDRLPAILDLIN